MIVQLRIAGTDLGTIKNVMFKPRGPSFKMSLYPLPPTEWVGPQVCDICGGKPDFLKEDSKPICNKCIDKLTRGLNKKESAEEPSIPITLSIISRTRFEWSVDGDKWYSIQGRNLKVDRPKIFLEEVKKSVLESRPMTVEGDYEKETKSMTIIT